MLPIVADAEAGFGGVLNAFELMKSMIEAGAAAVHFEDQLSSAKKCGHMGGKVLVPTREAIQKLIAARLAADVLDVPTVLIARTDANAAQLDHQRLRSERDAPFLTGERTVEGFSSVPRWDRCRHCARACVRALCRHAVVRNFGAESYGSEDDSPRPSMRSYPGKLLAYNCSPSFHWNAKLNEWEIAQFQQELGAMGYRFQFVTLAGFHALNLSAFELAHEYACIGNVCLFASCSSGNSNSPRAFGYGAVKHQRFVGTGYFDDVANTIAAGQTSDPRASRFNRGRAVRAGSRDGDDGRCGLRDSGVGRLNSKPSPHQPLHQAIGKENVVHECDCRSNSQSRRQWRPKRRERDSDAGSNGIPAVVSDQRFESRRVDLLRERDRAPSASIDEGKLPRVSRGDARHSRGGLERSRRFHRICSIGEWRSPARRNGRWSSMR